MSARKAAYGIVILGWLLALGCSSEDGEGDGAASLPGDGAGGDPVTSGGDSNELSGGAPSAGTGGSPGSGGGLSPGVGGATSPTGGASNGVGGSADGNGGSPSPDTGCGSHKWACFPMPNIPTSGLPNPASYQDRGDGTIYDEVTGLLWEAEPPASEGSWDDALNYCESLSLGGMDDWRLPTRIEITTVLDYSRPGWSSEAFSSAAGGFHRSASDWILTINQQGAGAGTDFAWAFNMSDGIVSNAYSKVSGARYRCVRSGGSGEGPSEPAVEPENHYTSIEDDQVLDNYTGLTWQSADSDEVDHAGAVAYCEALDLGGHEWRLPSIRELATLVDEAKVAPSINEIYFPETKYGSRSNNWYWASDEDALSDAHWALNFDDGFTGTNKGAEGSWNHFTGGYARCVR